MPTLTLHARYRLTGPRAVVLLVAVVGLFAMHGLSDHGATHWGMHAQASSVVAVGAQSHEAMTSTHGAHASPQSAVKAPETVQSNNRDGLPSGPALAGLCMAVLGLALTIFVIKAAQGPTRGAPIRASGRLAQLVHPRTADPPDRFLLRVHRC